jgi:hypothetical protein
VTNKLEFQLCVFTLVLLRSAACRWYKTSVPRYCIYYIFWGVKPPKSPKLAFVVSTIQSMAAFSIWCLIYYWEIIPRCFVVRWSNTGLQARCLCEFPALHGHLAAPWASCGKGRRWEMEDFNRDVVGIEHVIFLTNKDTTCSLSFIYEEIMELN